MRTSAIALAALLSAAPAAASDLDILVVGNSYVGSNNLGGTLRTMLTDLGEGDVRVNAHSPGGRRFVQHLADADGTNGDTQLRTWMTADATGWHVMVFQEQSQIPTFWDADPVYDESNRSFVGLDALARVAPGAPETVLFLTWGRRDGDGRNPALSPDFTTMQGRLTEGYRRYAQAAGADGRAITIAGVGPAFQSVHDAVVAQNEDPTAPGSCFHALYSGDGSHPSPAGTWLAGAVIAATISGSAPTATGDCATLYDAAVSDALAEFPPRGSQGDDDDSAGDDDDSAGDDDDSAGDDDDSAGTDDDDSPANDDDSSGDDDVGAGACAGCGGSAAMAVLLLPAGLQRRRRTS